ncbi:intermembrane lipid transfer protein VPS13D-like isoform X2 [Clytia hemisphaerica]|uniref:intermembrane lipid transfer protein VPS13D-like isoform X2 n=1 Tax=Clytia hemisphaerica TaxID=252671 RepID=UPI0034D42787
MLQSIALWLLKDYVGEYIENLNVDQLSIGYGGVELEKLVLKKTALRSLHLPFKLSSGYIGKLNLVIPYANPNTQPWIIKIEDLFLFVEPEYQIPEDEAEEELEKQKRKKLKKLEEEWKANMKSAQKGGWWSSSSWFPSLYSSFSTKIVENLQLQIKNVHLRYECKEESHQFAFGLQIENLSAQSANENWETQYAGCSTDKKFKSVKLENLSIYNDKDFMDMEVLKNKDSEFYNKNFKYILNPVSGEARICRNASNSPLSMKDGPRFHVEVLFDAVHALLSNGQYRLITDISEEITMFFKKKENKKWRPFTTVHEDSKAWWRFAIKTVLEPIKDKHRRCQKMFIMKHVKFATEYIPKYTKVLTQGAQVEADELKSVEDMEKELQFEAIAAMRKNVFSKIAGTASNEKINQKNQSSQTWTSWAMSYIPYNQANNASESDDDNKDLALTSEEEKFLADLSEAYSNDEESLYKRDAIFTEVSFTLNKCGVKLQDEYSSKVLLNVSFEALKFCSKVLLKTKYFHWTTSLGSMIIENPEKTDEHFPELVFPQAKENGNSSDKPFLEISFGKTTFPKVVNTLSIKLEASTVVYKPSLFSQIKEFFVLQERSRYQLNIDNMNSKLRQAVSSRLEELKNATKTELVQVVDNLLKGQTKMLEERWNISLDVTAPRIIIPLNQTSRSGIPVSKDEDILNKTVVINLGRVTFGNQYAKGVLEVTKQANIAESDEEDDEEDEFVTPSSTPPTQEEMKENLTNLCETLPTEEVKEKFYDSYTVELSMVQILVCNNKDISSIQLKGFGPDHVVEEFSVSFHLKRRIVFTTDPELPAVILTTVLPQLLIHIDENKLQALFSCVKMITNNQSKSSLIIKDTESTVSASKSSDTFLDVDTMDLLSESKLFMAKFTFEKLSLGLHSRGRCFAELQLKGIECEVAKRPYNLSVSFILSSLMLIDAIQTYGEEYELLVSSNKPTQPLGEEDVLINITYDMISSDAPSLDQTETTPLNILSVNFNTLFIIANLETMVELNNVLSQLLPKSSSSRHTKHGERKRHDSTSEDTNERRIELTATFRELDILIFRSIVKDFVKCPLKVSKVTVSNLELLSTVGSTMDVSGSIGNVTVIDLSSISFLRKNIFTVGEEAGGPSERSEGDPEKAFTFKLTKKRNVQELNIHIASGYYVHNPNFISEMVMCVGDYKQYAVNMAKSLQLAASDMAKSIVAGKPNFLSSPVKGVDPLFPQTTDSPSLQQGDTPSQGTFIYIVNINSPVVIFPKDSESMEFLVGHLGRIHIDNLNATNSKTTFGENIKLDIQKINLSMLNMEHDMTFATNMNQLLLERTSDMVSLLDNTDLFMQIQKTPPRFHQDAQQISILAKINTEIKLFLSVPVYQQILSTLQYSTSITGANASSSSTSIPTTPSAASSETSLSISVSAESQEFEEVAEESVPTEITAEFKMPCLQLELHGEMAGKSCGFVLIEFNDFNCAFSNIDRPFTTICITLQSFFIEDLLHPEKDKYRYLLSSTSPTQTTSAPSIMLKNERPSSSYPGERSIFMVNSLSTSLPNMLSEDASSFDEEVEGTSIQQMETPLISIKIVTTSDSHLEEEMMDSTQAKKSITVDMNNLDMVVNLQTWVILLEFFGIGSQQPQPHTPPFSPKDPKPPAQVIEEAQSAIASAPTDVNVNIKSLVLYLNKELYPLAKASVTTMQLNMSLDDGNQDISGSVGKVVLMDLSPYKGLYGIRLISSGEKALDFSFFRYGRPDPFLNRDHDMDLTLSMSALQYVHTQRFLMETISFAQHFVFLQEVLGRMRAANEGKKVHAIVNRCARLKLKVQAEAPILILPRKTSCADVLVANLGKLSEENQFLYASDQKTNAFNFIASRSRSNLTNDEDEEEEEANTDRLLDCINIRLTDMEVYSALKVETREEKLVYVHQGEKMMVDPCFLNLMVERNLEWAFGRQVPDMSVTGHLSSVAIDLDLSQFSLIMGMLGENLGEPLDAFQAPLTVIVDPLEMNSTSSQVWTNLHIKLNLSNVTLITSPTFSFGPFKGLSTSQGGKLGKFDLINSKFVFESFSDKSKAMNLVSSDVLLHDIRSPANTGILMPCTKNRRTSNYLQFEVHYLDTKDKSRLTFLCNESRILLQFEFLLQVMNFILRKEENQLSGKASEQGPVMTKRSSPTVLTKVDTSSNKNTPPSPKKKQFELKVNITESELVVVEDIKIADSRTVILKTTAVFFYRPDHPSERPISCSLQSLEIFSCCLSAPDDSALSIVDPVAFLVELNNQVKRQSNVGLLDAVENKPMLEVQFQVPVNIRLSYHDVQMFKQIVKSAQQQIASALSQPTTSNSSSHLQVDGKGGEPSLKKRKVTRLNSKPSALGVDRVDSSSASPPQSNLPISGFELKTDLVSLIIIDDCGDTDVPLLDIRFNKIMMHHDFVPEWKGSSECQVATNYYNTRVSAWEPFLESWRFNVHWFKFLDEKQEKTVLKVDAPERLDMNMTSAFVDICKTTAGLWTTKLMEDQQDVREKKRAPFLPFVLRNRTGVKLSFNTLMTSPKSNTSSSLLKVNRSRLLPTETYHHDVENGDELPFSFQHRSKQRHQATHSLTVHQMIVKLPGLNPIKPITVDRVGEFYRIATHQDTQSTTSNQMSSKEDVYVMMDIKLEGARKVITVHSALIVQNKLSLPVELVAELCSKQYSMCILPAKETFYVPINLLQSKLYVRPIRANWSFQLSNDEISWRNGISVQETSFVRSCKTDSVTTPFYKFTAVIRRLALNRISRDYEFVECSHPEHHITLLHSVVLENQLPCDLFYTFKGSAMKSVVMTGDVTPLHVEHHAGDEMSVFFSCDNFQRSDPIRVSSEEKNYVQPIRLYDMHDRVLFLRAFIKYRSGTVLISVSAPFWLVNKMSIPLVFKREEDEKEVAGQFEEHEEARSLTPLLFSFFSTEYMYTCQMRVGKNYRRNEFPNRKSTSIWSRAFNYEKEFEHRSLYVRREGDRMEKAYQVGIITKWGKGVFSRTKIVTFVPLFQIKNLTEYKLKVTQCSTGNESEEDVLPCDPGVLTNFHWSAKWDRILRLRLHDIGEWSGGFRIDKETTYHLAVKSNRNEEVTLQVSVAFKNGTYRCVFLNGEDFPPPYRILNFSEVPLFYCQTNENNSEIRNVIRPKECKDYVMDEPLQPHSLTFNVFQECSESYDLSTKMKGGYRKLYYQNAIFIAFDGNSRESIPSSLRATSSAPQTTQLVLDVVHDRKIVLAIKAEHKLSQLWRMNADGNLVQFKPEVRRTSSAPSRRMVLDVEQTKDGKGNVIQKLVLNQYNPDRASTQTWFFESSSLKCCMNGYAVQGVDGLRANTLAVLTKYTGETFDKHYYAIRRQKLRPGSGVLSVRLYAIGPTQVVEVSDSQHDFEKEDMVFIEGAPQLHGLDLSRRKIPSTEISVSLAAGFGLSLVNLYPEEVVFATFSHIRFMYEFTPRTNQAEIRIGAVQIDNQLFGSQQTVALFAAPPTASTNSSSTARQNQSADRTDLRILLKVEKDPDYGFLVFKKFHLDVTRLYIRLEDRLLLKLIQAVQSLMMQEVDTPTAEIQNLFDSHHRLDVADDEIQQKIFFEDVKVNQGDLNISLVVTGKIDGELATIKKNLGLYLASFDAAVIVFESYIRNNMFETFPSLQTHIKEYYIQTFKNQITSILGSLDILGNPMGLFQDFSSGMEGLLKKGNVGGLFVNVAHGMSNSAAKMTGVLADGLWSASGKTSKVSRDTTQGSQSSTSHVSAGLKGLGKGVFGGLTSMITEPLEGASKKGVGGFLSGIGKGIVGTVAKPMAGVLDLASGTAAAVRTSTETSVPVPPVVRLKRNCYGPGGVLSKYSKNASEGQEVLRCFNQGDDQEMYVAMEVLRKSDRLKALLTNKGLYIVRSGPPSLENIDLHVEYSLFVDAVPIVEGNNRHNLEIYYYPEKPRIGMMDRQQRYPIRCDGENQVANRVSQKANHLKSLHDEAQFSVAQTNT